MASTDRIATASPPQLAVSTAVGNMSATYMFVMLDLDVPPQKGGSTRRVLLHAMNTDFKPTKQKISGAAMLLASDSKGPAPYLSPGPPATDTVAHRYVQLLFQQPANLKVKASDFANTTARFDFDINSFMSTNGLGAPMAGNFFKVDGRANATEAAGGSATESGGRSRSSAKPFEGAAAGLDVSHGLAGLLGGLVMLAV